MCGKFKIQKTVFKSDFKPRFLPYALEHMWSVCIWLWLNSPLAAQVMIIPVYSCHAALSGRLHGLVDSIFQPKMYMDRF